VRPWFQSHYREKKNFFDSRSIKEPDPPPPTPSPPAPRPRSATLADLLYLFSLSVLFIPRPAPAPPSRDCLAQLLPWLQLLCASGSEEPPRADCTPPGSLTHVHLCPAWRKGRGKRTARLHHLHHCGLCPFAGLYAATRSPAASRAPGPPPQVPFTCKDTKVSLAAVSGASGPGAFFGRHALTPPAFSRYWPSGVGPGTVLDSGVQQGQRNKVRCPQMSPSSGRQLVMQRGRAGDRLRAQRHLQRCHGDRNQRGW
jgi:hypothetical protein